MHWLLDIALGLVLAGLLYAIVRLRMNFAPKMKQKYGATARWATWALTLLLMIVAANVTLELLRQLVSLMNVEAPLLDEILFALVAFAVGFALVARHVTRNRR